MDVRPYQEKVAAATREKGGRATLRKKPAGTVDWASDSHLPVAPVDYACWALWLPYAPLFGLGVGESIQGGVGRIIRGEVCYIAGNAFPAGVEPAPGDDLLTVDGRQRAITTVEALRLDGAVPIYFKCGVSP
jgi:hypothetical protein